MRKFFTLLGLCAVAAQPASAIVNVSAQENSGISYLADVNAANTNLAIAADPTLKLAVMNGDDVLMGNRVLIGTFLISEADVRARNTDLNYLMQNFRMYGSEAMQAKVGDGFGVAGHFTKQVVGNADANGLVDANIYMFILAATNNTSLATSISSAFQAGIYRAPLAAWKFPSETGVPNNTAVDLTDLTVSQNGEFLSPGVTPLLGSFGSGTNADRSNATSARNFVLAAVPEPGTGLLALAGGVALLLRRRRRV